MGNCDFKKELPSTTNIGISKVNFQLHYVVGRGGYGKVENYFKFYYFIKKIKFHI
jgi:hypothetical protein